MGFPVLRLNPCCREYVTSAMSILRTIHRAGQFAGILPVPVLIHGVRYFCQPGAVFDELQYIRCGEKLNAILRWIAQRLKQTGRDEDLRIVGWHLSTQAACSTVSRAGGCATSARN
jgi:hypothetical protein